MRAQETAADDARIMIVYTIQALQDAAAPTELIDDAEELYSDIQEWNEDSG